MHRRTFISSLGFIPFIGYLAPKQIRILIPSDVSIGQLVKALSEIYRIDDSEEVTPEFVLADGRILCGKQHYVQTIYEYDLRCDTPRPRIYREVFSNKSSVSLFRYNWFLLNCCMATNEQGSFMHIAGPVREIVDRLPSDEFAITLADKIGDQGKYLRDDLIKGTINESSRLRFR